MIFFLFRWKYTVYYFIIWIENVVLSTLWFVKVDPAVWYRIPLLSVVIMSLVAGLSLLIVYYQFLHPNKIWSKLDQTLGSSSRKSQPETIVITSHWLLIKFITNFFEHYFYLKKEKNHWFQLMDFDEVLYTQIFKNKLQTKHFFKGIFLILSLYTFLPCFSCIIWQVYMDPWVIFIFHSFL